MTEWLNMQDLEREYDELRSLRNDHLSDEHDDELEENDECPLCDEDAKERLTLLETLHDELGGWDYDDGIPESEFTDYAQQLAEDIGAIDPKATHGWPFDHIDWEGAAEALKQDYTSFDFEGVSYYTRER